MADLHVRVALPGEYASVGELTVTGFSHHRAPGAERLALLRDAAGRARDGELLVAVDEVTGLLVGTASLLRAGTESARLAEPGEAELRLLAVLTHHRGRGVGYALMQAAIERATAWGATALVLDTGPTNADSHRLYHRLGFERAPARETRPSRSGAPLAVFRLPLEASNGVRVRLAAPEEYDRAGELILAAYSHDYDLPEHYRAELRTIGDHAHEVELWVAEHLPTGLLVGAVVTARPGRRLGELAGEGELDFRMLAVDPQTRGGGVGQLLVEHVIALARLRGARRVVMNSGPQMLGAHRLYARLGFVRLTDRETYVLPNGTTLLAFGLDVHGVGIGG